MLTPPSRQRPPPLPNRYDKHVSVPDHAQPPVCALTDATSLLWRLEMLHAAELQPPMPGIPLPSASVAPFEVRQSKRAVAAAGGSSSGARGSRWEDLAACWDAFLPSVNYSAPPGGEGSSVEPPQIGRWFAWNDVHAAMALSVAARGRQGSAAAGAAGEALQALLADMGGAAARAAQWGGGAGGGGGACSEAGDAAFLAARCTSLGVPMPRGLGLKHDGLQCGWDGAGPLPPPDQARALNVAGWDAARGMVAFAGGEYEEAAQLLRKCRPHWKALGGSHVQRDVLELTLLNAAVRVGGDLGRALASERVTVFSSSPRAWHVYAGAMRKSAAEVVENGGREQLLSRAVTAEDRAHALGSNQGPGY